MLRRKVLFGDLTLQKKPERSPGFLGQAWGLHPSPNECSGVTTILFGGSGGIVGKLVFHAENQHCNTQERWRPEPTNDLGLSLSTKQSGCALYLDAGAAIP